MSVFKRIWQRFIKPTYFVGRDLEGNKYYEFPNANNGRSKRTIEYQRRNDMWTYVASGKRLPVQWNAWLTHTRSHPPSIEELQADLARQHRVQMNAVHLEARDQEERKSMLRLAQYSHSQVSELPSQMEPAERREKMLVNAQPANVPTQDRDPWVEATRKDLESPEPWIPVVRRP